MELDAIRFSIGPWKGCYSSTWRIWSNKGDDNIYLGASCLLQKLKISLHQSGKFRVALVDTYHAELIKKGKDPEKDRAFIKWEKPPIRSHDVYLALNVDFPLESLGSKKRPETRKEKKLFLLEPNAISIEDNNCVSLKVLFHKVSPRSDEYRAFLNESRLMPFVYSSLSNGEHCTVAFTYTKFSPIEFKKEEIQSFGHSLLRDFKAKGKNIGDRVENLSLLCFENSQMGLRVCNVGGISAVWNSETSFSVSMGENSQAAQVINDKQ